VTIWQLFVLDQDTIALLFSFVPERGGLHGSSLFPSLRRFPGLDFICSARFPQFLPLSSTPGDTLQGFPAPFDFRRSNVYRLFFLSPPPVHLAMRFFKVNRFHVRFSSNCPSAPASLGRSHAASWRFFSQCLFGTALGLIMEPVSHPRLEFPPCYLKSERPPPFFPSSLCV